jgi:hypothetical protein
MPAVPACTQARYLLASFSGGNNADAAGNAGKQDGDKRQQCAPRLGPEQDQQQARVRFCKRADGVWH